MRTARSRPFRLVTFSVLACLTIAGIALANRHAGPTTSSFNSCPTRDQPPPQNQNASAKSILVPTPATSAAVCRYYGLNSWPPGVKHRSHHGRPSPWAGKLASSDLGVRSPRVMRLAELFDGLRPVPAGKVFHCPFDDGSEILAIFGYANAPEDPVRVSLRGCQWATNGFAGQTYWMSGPLRRELLSLTRLRRMG